MHDGMPYGRNQGQSQGHSREVDRQSPTGLILVYFVTDFIIASVFEFVGTGHTCAVHVQLLYSGEH